MKKLLAIVFFTFHFSFFISCFGQTYVYYPFPDSNAYWNETAADGSCGTGVDMRDYVYIVHGDTNTNGYIYHKVYQIWGYWSNTCSTPFQTWLYDSSFYGAYRADTMKHIYACCTNYLGPHDSLLYDFNLKVGDTLTQYTARRGGGPGPCTVHSIDSVLVNTHYRKRLNIAINGDTTIFPSESMVEGIGSTIGLFDFFYIPFEGGTGLNCFTQNDTTWQPPDGNPSAFCGLYYASVNNVKMAAPSISVYPNPSSGNFEFQITHDSYRENESGKLNVQVYNVLGEKVYNSPLTIHHSQFTIDLSNQPNGVYVYRVMSNNGNLIGEGKIIIQK